MAKSGERASPCCPICGRRLRIKPGTKRTTLLPLWQCREGVSAHPEQGYEWSNAMLQMMSMHEDEDH